MIAPLLAPFHSPEKTKVLEAINSLGLKVSPEDIAVKEGMPLSVVTYTLNEIAAETNGNLRVSDTGTIQYVFDPAFEMRYISNAARSTWLSVWRIFINVFMMAARFVHLVIMTLFRVSVGVILIVSVIAVIALILLSIARMFSDSSDSGDSTSSSASSFDFGSINYFMFSWMFDWWLWGRFFNPWYGSRHSWFWHSPFDPFYYGSYGSRGRNLYYDDNYWVDPFFFDHSKQKAKGAEKPDEKGPDFMSICYQFVFGPEDPDKDIGERYWKLIAAVIRNNDGVVVAEQLAPYTGHDEESEDWMLPILTRFEGAPEVSNRGNIIYVFPKFVPAQPAEIDEPDLPLLPSQQTGASINADDLRKMYREAVNRQVRPNVKSKPRQKIDVPQYMEEELLSFVDFDMSKLTIPVLLGMVELGGSIYLFTQMGNLPGLLVFKPLIIFLLGYGAFFFLYPAARALIMATRNTMTLERNEKRFELSSNLLSPSPKLAMKVKEATDVRTQVARTAKRSGKEVYTTEKDWLEQQF